MREALLLSLALVLSAPCSAAQPQPTFEPPSQEDLSIQEFLREVETAVSTMDVTRWLALLSPNADHDDSRAFFEAAVPPAVTRVVLKERDRAALAGALPGDGYRLTTELFVEMGSRGRIATVSFDIRKPRDDDAPQPWRIVAQEQLSLVEGLHRLNLSRDRTFVARNLVLKSVDFEVRLPEGRVFAAETEEGPTALVLMGNGTMLFAPRPREEQGQLRLFARTERLETGFTTALVRISPYEFRSQVGEGTLQPVEQLDTRAFRRATQAFDEDIGKSYSLDLSDLSRDTWSLLPQPGDFVAEVRTRRHGKLTYARSASEPEDVSLFQRERKRNIALYASEQKLAVRGRFYNEDDLADFDVLDYQVDTTFTPEREWLEGRTRLRLRVQAFALPAITLRLAESLTVNSVTSDELGRLLFLRINNQNAIIINLPSPVVRGSELTLHLTYQGRMIRQRISDDSVRVDADQGAGVPRRFDQPPEDFRLVQPEPNWLFSNRAQWYPQAQVTDYATAMMRITVPADYTVVASGIQELGSPEFGGTETLPHASFMFSAVQPVRYLSMIVSRMTRADAATVALGIVPPDSGIASGPNGPEAGIPPVGARNTVDLVIDANRRQEGRARDAVDPLVGILQLYASLIGDVPYDALNVAMVESELPGGHAPAYVAVINNPLPTTPFSWRNDPASFNNFPEFFMAHELAHQWFGQGVGWKNYHEQWLSEGFAQYLAALYAREKRGEPAFREILKQFRRWAIEESDQGPVYLGYRLGHIRNEARVFRALVYNKGAAVLHMLRLFVGDEAFWDGVRRFYRDHRFAKAGTGDLQAAMEAASGRDLTRFFERWIFDAGIPRLRYATTVNAGDVTVRIEQTGELYDVPVTVTVQYDDGTVAEVVMRVTEAVTEKTIPTTGTVRGVELNQDNATVAHFDRGR